MSLLNFDSKFAPRFSLSLLFAGGIALFSNAHHGAAIAQVNSQAMVNAHNALRSEVGVPSIRWSSPLANEAQGWADTLVNRGGNLSHNPNTSHGENIFWISGRSASAADVVGSWGSEKQYFRYGVYPNVSTTGRGSDVGHYTQIIWANTTEVGCGMASSGGAEIWVCNYNPPGNYTGQSPY